MADLKWRYATPADIQAMFGEPLFQTVQAAVVDWDGKPSLIVGIAKYADHAQFFADYPPEMHAHLKSLPVLRAIKAAMAFVSQSALPVYTMSTPEEPQSPGFIERLGFKHHETRGEHGIYQWPR